jgi:hypothetical protein
LPSRVPARSRLRSDQLGLLVGLAASSVCAGAACSSEDASCGSDGAPSGDVVAADSAGSGVELRFHDLRARRNNDCPAVDAPAGLVSLTLSGTSLNGTSPLTFCVPRPDLLRGARALGSDIQVIDVLGADATCSYRQLRGSTPSGTVTASGVCQDGADPAGFALEFNGVVFIERTCGGTTDTLRMTLTGKVAVARSTS